MIYLIEVVFSFIIFLSLPSPSSPPDCSSSCSFTVQGFCEAELTSRSATTAASAQPLGATTDSPQSQPQW